MADKSRKQAASELHAIQECYEVKPLSLATVYQRIYRLNNGDWHLVGKAHDYTTSGESHVQEGIVNTAKK